MVQFIPGRLAPHAEATHPRLKLADYLTGALPPAPAAVDWYSRVTDWPVFLNDQLGDCTAAMVGHLIEEASAYGQGAVTLVGDGDVLTSYERVSGYVPGDPSTDNGSVLQDVYNDWRKNGVGGHHVLVFAQVDHTDDGEIRQAVALFGAVGLGIVVTQDMMDDFHAGHPWTRAAGTALGGHAVPVVGYDADHVFVVTWGQVRAMSWGCLAAVTDEAWVAVLPEWFSAAGVDPTGLDLHALGEDFAVLTGEPNPFPQPAPAPPAPMPVPPAPVPPKPTPDPLADLVALIRTAVRAFETWAHRHGF